MQALAPLIAGSRDYDHAQLIATAYSFRQEHVDIAGFDQFAAADVDKMRPGLERK